MSDTPKLIQFLINHDNPKHAISGCRDLQELEDARQWIREWSDHSVTHSMIDVDAAMDALTDRIDELKHGSPLIRTLKQHHILGQLDAQVKALEAPEWSQSIIGVLPEFRPLMNHKSTLRPLLDKTARSVAEWSPEMSADFFNDPQPGQEAEITPPVCPSQPHDYEGLKREYIFPHAIDESRFIDPQPVQEAKSIPTPLEKILTAADSALKILAECGLKSTVFDDLALAVIEARSFKPSSAETFAAELYSAYGDDAAWKNFQGNEMPQWGALPPAIRAHWIAVAIRASIQTPGASPS